LFRKYFVGLISGTPLKGKEKGEEGMEGEVGKEDGKGENGNEGRKIGSCQALQLYNSSTGGNV
jgi:hypothetical protein